MASISLLVIVMGIILGGILGRISTKIIAALDLGRKEGKRRRV